MQFVLLSAFLRMKNKNMPEKICRETFTNRKLSFVSQAALLDTSTTLTERPMPRVEPKLEKKSILWILVYSLDLCIIHLTYIEKVWPTAPNNLHHSFLFHQLFYLINFFCNYCALKIIHIRHLLYFSPTPLTILDRHNVMPVSWSYPRP